MHYFESLSLKHVQGDSRAVHYTVLAPNNVCLTQNKVIKVFIVDLHFLHFLGSPERLRSSIPQLIGIEHVGS